MCCVDDDDVDRDDTGNLCFIYDVHSMINMIVGRIKVRCPLHAIQIKG